MTRASKQKKFWLVPMLLVIVVAGGWLTYRAVLPPFAPPALPVPNGYDDFLKAATMLAPRTGFYDEMEADELTAVVSQNLPAVEFARKGLQKECMVVVDWWADQAGLDAHFEQLGSIRNLARAFAANAAYAKSIGRSDQAVNCGLDLLDLAPAATRGGLVVDRQLGQAIVGMGLQILRNQVDLLTAEQCEKLRQRLLRSPVKLESPQVAVDHDIAFARQVNGVYTTVAMAGLIHNQTQQTIKQVEQADQRLAAQALLLQTHLALRVFQLAENRLPSQLEELFPEYVSKVPQDSFAGEPMIYRSENNGYLLYSVGLNGIDDGGVDTTDGTDGDLLLEPTK